RRQHEARFVQQSDTGAALEGLTDDARPVVGYPAFHLLVVTLAGGVLGLLAGPSPSALSGLLGVARGGGGSAGGGGPGRPRGRRSTGDWASRGRGLPPGAALRGRAVARRSGAAWGQGRVWPPGHQGGGRTAASATGNWG